MSTANDRLQIAKSPETSKVCADCKQDKPLTEYYINSNGYPYKRCKVCRRKRFKSSKANNAPPAHEQLIVETLISKGIPAMHGRDAIQYKHVDIVAFGCIRIEAKLFKPAKQACESDNAGWYSGNSNAQKKGWLVS